MKTNSTAIKGFKAVDFMREVRDKISMDIKDMKFEEIRKYMETRQLKLNSTYKSGSSLCKVGVRLKVAPRLINRTGSNFYTTSTFNPNPNF